MADLWQEIIDSISREKMRTCLTGLAIAWGIFMLIVLLGAGNGLIHAFEKNSSEQILNSVKVFPGFTTRAYEGFNEGRAIELDNKDLELTRQEFPNNVIDVGSILQQTGIYMNFGKEYVSLTLTGVYPNYTNVETVKIVSGRFINQLDMKERRKVIIIHKKTAEILFGPTHTEPIGQVVNAGGVAYRIVGIFSDPGDRDFKEAYVPFTTLRLVYNMGDVVDRIVFTTKNLTSVTTQENFERRYRGVIGAHHRFDPADEGALWIWNRSSHYMTVVNTVGLLRIVIWVIGIFALLSGVVGVSNIMLITVKERTREFGIRKALGAKPVSILVLIISESVVITTMFGYVGMFAGILLTEWMNINAGQQVTDAGVFQQTMFLNPTVDISIAVEATLVLIIAGTLAGFFPAKKAVSIKPIEALRSE